MTYNTKKMTVTIFDPNTPDGMTSDLTMIFTCDTFFDSDNYGNGCYISISDKKTFENYYDVRYDSRFKKDTPEEWLTEWAYNYWNGENGAYKVKQLTIE